MVIDCVDILDYMFKRFQIRRSSLISIGHVLSVQLHNIIMMQTYHNMDGLAIYLQIYTINL